MKVLMTEIIENELLNEMMIMMIIFVVMMMMMVLVVMTFIIDMDNDYGMRPTYRLLCNTISRNLYIDKAIRNFINKI
jgi:hypothetical protein